MKNKHSVLPDKNLEPYKVRQALAGMALGPADDFIVRYLDFFSSDIPMEGIRFLHVVPEIKMKDVLYGKVDAILTSDFSYETEEFELKMSVTSTFSGKDKIKIETEVTEGDPLATFLAKAKEIDSDLLVIGRSKTEVDHSIWSKNLARRTESNVLVIPEGSKAKISTILVPIDFSPNSAKAIHAAVRLHKQLQQPARIICFHVYRMPNASMAKNTNTKKEFKTLVENCIIEAFTAFLYTETGDYADKIEMSLAEKHLSDVPTLIMSYAKKNKVNFMVVGSKGHSKVHLLLLGSVAEAIFDKNDSIPTLIVR